MASVRAFALPDLGEGLTSAEIVRWLVAVGDVIAIDQPVAEVETAKAVVEVPCPYAGVVTTLAGPEGTVVPVGAALVTVAVSEASGGTPSKDEGSGNVLVGYGTSHSTGPRRRRVAHPGSPAPTTAPAPSAPVVVTEPVAIAAVISPLVRRFARDSGVDLATVVGTGRDGLIMRADVERAAQAHTVPAAPSAEGEFVPLRGGARIAAERFARSRSEIPDATCWVDADATALLEAKAAVGVGVLPLFARISVAALRRFPALNSSVELGPDGVPTGVRRHRAIHLGFAAQSERGLVVPVVRDADQLSTEGLAAEIGRLTESARAGTLTPAELTGSTFTLNNYGVFGVDGSTPIINHPEAAMLGVGRIARKPWVVGDDLAVRSVVQLSFTFDHRVCDGATAGGFLRFVADAVESPVALLRHM
ncbi:dihydrolipoamide acetyltransferase family protein [Streptacidiphilus jiangxiensis]|uniref:Dihydrolipoamide acetyltransferase component of pyruvate dehydrogenase complex n=1 Tax=Streptacidiphilus jiangxiensis TaxID=235985 RepID=A0A1H7JG84_STRJI|nr:dihydrolipoamide acetyltransferase family protein [Streptacidiphilus jiangxiensis]SEK73424.1 pyruvate dehydrogenase E2 component (dihydrolipoamide acetyltransferase) [Streptacidiphilus jiangxiensis]